MATYYVSTTGSDAANGSEATPWATVAHACATASANDTIIVSEGTYTDAVAIAVSGLTVRGATGQAKPIIYGGAAVAGSWVNHAGNVWKITSYASDPQALIFRPTSTTWVKGDRRDSVLELDAEYKWYYDSGATTLYVYAATTPATRYYRVDNTSQTGTSGLYANSGGVYLLTADDVTLEGLAVYGWDGNGVLGDDCDSLTIRDCDLSYNSEDGCGGYNLPSFTVFRSRCCWNGTRKARSLPELLTDGDGVSTHKGGAMGAGAPNFLVSKCYFEGNTKSAVQNINNSAGVVERCLSVSCNLNFVINAVDAGSEQTVRSCKVVCNASDLGGIGASTSDRGNFYGCTVYGAAASGVAGFFVLSGTVYLVNCIITNFDVGVSVLAGTLNHTYNCFGGNTSVGVVLSTGEITTNPALSGTSNGQFGILRTSPCFNTGTDLSGSGVTHDFSGKRKSATAKSMGAMEPSRAGGSLLLSALFAEMDIL
jgi:hypothetical protein